MVVGDEKEAKAFALQGDMLLDGPKIVAQMQLARGLNPAQNPLGLRHLSLVLGHWSVVFVLGNST
jgi:hypothetical protein